MQMKYTARGTLSLFMVLQWGCGDDATKDASDDDRDDAIDAGQTETDAGAEDAGEQEPSGTSLDAKLDADGAAKELCRFMPWAIAGLDGNALPAAKIENQLREDQAVFIDDKPPICIDSPDATEDLCNEKPSGAKTFAYLYRAEGAAATDPAEQVWCKSDSYADLALIKGAEKAKKGDCATLQQIVVTWAEAQLEAKPARSIKFASKLVVTGSEWSRGLVTTSEDGDVLTVTGPELYAPTKADYERETGPVPTFLESDFFGNHYCKVLSPSAVLAWLTGP